MQQGRETKLNPAETKAGESVNELEGLKEVIGQFDKTACVC